MNQTFKLLLAFICLSFSALLVSSCDDDDAQGPSGDDEVLLVTAQMGAASLLTNDPAVPVSENINLGFDAAIDPATNEEIQLFDGDGNPIELSYRNFDNNRIIELTPDPAFSEGSSYVLSVSEELRGLNGEAFDGLVIEFVTLKDDLLLLKVSADGVELNSFGRTDNISLFPTFEVEFSNALEESAIEENVVLVGDVNYPLSAAKTGEATYELTPQEPLDDLTEFNLLFPASLGEDIDRPFETESFELFTQLDSTPDFPIISDEELLTLVQEQTFKYFWDFGHPVSGLARERNTSGELVTAGGSGFGLMAMIVGVERGFITRDEALDRWETIFNFLEDTDRFHGAWPHWFNGSTGSVIPFSELDDGGDLVETAFLVQGMITVREYLDPQVPRESEIRDLIDTLWYGVEWDWYTKGGENVLYWHWSPENEWAINLPIRGHNETQIIYTLAAASPTHSIEPEVYTSGYARSGGMQNGNTFYGYELPVGSDRGGPLFFAHYSYLGMDPRNLQDEYANYWEQNINHSLINRAYCVANPANYVGYSEDCWGLTASDGNNGYSAHSPDNDRGVITPTAAISSIPYTPEESIDAIRHFYYLLGDRLWGEYGFYDAFNLTAGWYASSYLAIDQGPIICMIENYRTGLLWDLYMSAPEVQDGLDKLGFTY